MVTSFLYKFIFFRIVGLLNKSLDTYIFMLYTISR